MGLGVADERSKLFNLFDGRAKKEISNSAACGVINTSYFDINGTFIPLYEENKIGIPLETLKKIPRKVIVCSGKPKADALLGALRGGYIDVLITDSLAVEAIETKLAN
jgi:DNA-binding transcriptional regulator LsrR (DeoR family)